ncbi:unnamed protein product [Pylaiella littoralis]
MVEESAPVLSFGAFAAAFKKKTAGGDAISPAKAAVGDEIALQPSSSGTIEAVLPDSSSCATASGGRGGDQQPESGGDEGGAAASKILPRTASLVGGKQWAVLASVYDTTASVVDETIGNLFT